MIKKLLLPFLFCLTTVAYYAQNCSVNANINQTICATGSMQLLGSSGGLFNITANWVQIGGPAVSITAPNSLTTAVTGFLGGNTYTFRLKAKCQDGTDVFNDVQVLVLQNTLANAGASLPGACPGTATLAGNAVGVGETGAWSVVGANNAGVTITTPSSPTSQIVLGTSSTGTTTLMWTITNVNGCVSTSTMNVSNFGGVAPVNAGPDQTLSNCYSATQSTNLNATFVMVLGGK
jgi:large repetitive protein